MGVADTDASQAIFGKADKFELPSPAALVRPAKLCFEGREMLCVVLDLADRLIKVDPFGAIPAHTELHFELAGGDRFEVVLAWQEDGQAGLLVIGKVREGAVPSTGDGQMAVRRVRLLVGAEVQLQAGDSSHNVRLVNISQQGAGIVSRAMLSCEDPVNLELPNLPALAAWVRWSTPPRYGLEFRQVLTLEELAAVSGQLQRRPGAPWLKLAKLW